MKCWDGLDFTTLILLLVTEARSYLNILGWESLKKQLVPRVFGLWNKKTFVEQDNWVQEDWGLVSGEHLTYFGNEAISGVLIILFPNINWLLLNLICLSSLFKIVTRQVVSSLSTMKCLYEILKAKMFFGDIYFTIWSVWTCGNHELCFPDQVFWLVLFPHAFSIDSVFFLTFSCVAWLSWQSSLVFNIEFLVFLFFNFLYGEIFGEFWICNSGKWL